MLSVQNLHYSPVLYIWTNCNTLRQTFSIQGEILNYVRYASLHSNSCGAGMQESQEIERLQQRGSPEVSFFKEKSLLAMSLMRE